ncbi:MAG: tRNA-specific adenosine deaminase [Myxococcales bacterium]
MREALALARTAEEQGEVPVGAVVIDPAGHVIGRGANRRELDADPTAHAEMVALRQAAKVRGSWRLNGCTLVVTLEPCPMCAGALVASRLERVVFGCRDPKGGAVTTLYAVPQDPRLNHRVEVEEGVLADACSAVLQGFFADLREQRRAGRVAEGA